MNTRAKSKRDAFAFSLRGLSAKSSFVPMPVLADDRIHKAREKETGRSRADQPNAARQISFVWGRFWLRTKRRGA